MTDSAKSGPVKRDRNEIFVGAFVIIGFIILTLIVFFVSGVYFFQSGYKVEVIYEYVSVLDKGAPVRMAGVRIGEVSSVRLVHDDEDGQTRVAVKLFIEKEVKIRENYLFYIRGTHILSEPHIEISPQPGNFPLIEANAVIEGVDPTPIEALIQRGHAIARDLEEMVANLRGALEDEETSKALKQVVLNMAELTESFKKLMSDSEGDIKEARHNINTAVEALSRILDKMEKGEGTVGRLLAEDELYQEVREFVAEIKAHPWRLLKKDGKRSKFLGIV